MGLSLAADLPTRRGVASGTGVAAYAAYAAYAVNTSRRTAKAATRPSSTVTPMPGRSKGTVTQPSASIVHSGSTMSCAQ
jgi:hypothetical protein